MKQNTSTELLDFVLLKITVDIVPPPDWNVFHITYRALIHTIQTNSAKAALQIVGLQIVSLNFQVA